MNECVVGGFAKSQTEMIVGTVSPFEERILAHLRVAVPSATEDGEWIRTRKGVAVPVDDFKEILKALKKLNGVAASTAVGGRLAKGKKTEIRVYLEPFRGDVYCHVRIYDLKDDRPGRGVAVRVDLLPELIDLAEQVQAAIEKRCWETSE